MDNMDIVDNDSEILILRLKNSEEDIVAECKLYQEDDNEYYHLINPMVVLIQPNKNDNKSSLFMISWLPISIIQENTAYINMGDILCILRPNQMFEKYYLDVVEELANKSNSSIKQEEYELEKLDLEEALIELETMDKNQIN